MLVTGEEQSGSSARDASLHERVVLAVGFAGLIAYSRLFSLGFAGYLDQGLLVSTDGHYLARTVATLAMLAVLALAGRNRWFGVGAAGLVAAALVSVAAVLVTAVNPSSIAGLPVAVAGGASDAVLLFAWMLSLSRYQPYDIVATTLVGLVLAGFVIVSVPLVGADLGFDIAAISVLLAGIGPFVLDPKLESLRCDGALEPAQIPRVPWLTFASMLACSLLSGVLYGAAAGLSWFFGWEPNLYAFGLGVTLVIGATVVMMSRSRAWMHVVWAPLFTLFALSLVFACIPAVDAVRAAVGLAMAAVFCANFLPWMVFPAIFSTVRIPRSFLAGIALLGVNSSLAALIGGAVGSALPASMQNLAGLAGVVAVALATLFAVSYMLYRRFIGTVGIWSQASAAPSALPLSSEADAVGEVDAEDADAGPVDALRRRIDSLVGEYGLTPRETEVALLTVQGFSCAYIADKLVVSNSTVRFHQQNIYRKLEVHSRNELIEFVSF